MTELLIDALSVTLGRRRIFDKLTLRPVRPGCMLAVLGPNGVGKSTLLRAVARLVSARGNVSLGRIDLLHGSHGDHVKHVGYLPQTLPQASTLLVYEAVSGALRATCGRLSNVEHDARVQAVFAQLHLDGLAMKPLDRLSGGQRQMVGLAQVLVRQTPLLLLDEPTSALDLRWQLLALEAMRNATKRKSAIVVVAMHDLNLASRFCDRVLLLGPQGVLADGPPSDALEPDQLRRAYSVDARLERTARGECLVVVERAVVRADD